jgi:hypothetical protein
MNKLMFVVAVGAMLFIGYLYLIERDEVTAARDAMTAAASSTAKTLAAAPGPQNAGDSDAGAVFKRALPETLKIEDVAVRQSVEPLSPGHFRQSVKVFGRARTSMSEFFNLQGAEIEVTATQDFERAK